MKNIIALLAVIALAYGAVVDLTPENFDSVVDGSKGAFVEFFAPWCGHCKTLAPEYEIVGESFGKSSDVVIAKVDADAHKELGSRFDVHGFPTLKWFPKGSKEPVAYEGGRSADDIVNWINEKAGTSARVKKAPSDIAVLTDANFDRIVLNSDKDVLVEFYAPWCGHCKTLAPIWAKLATVFSADKNVVIANIDADKYRDIGSKYGVSGFPTIKYFPKANKETPQTYEGARDLGDFVSFINKNAGTQRTNEGVLDAQAGRHAGLDEIIAKFFSGEQATLIADAEKVVETLAEDAVAAGKIYVKYMKTVAEKGKDWIATEVARLERLATGSVARSKLDDFTRRKNILSAFN